MGLNVEQMAASAYRAFSHALGDKDSRGDPLPAWEDIREDMQHDWWQATALTVSLCDGEEDAGEDLPWYELASALYRSFAKRQYALSEKDVPPFHHQPPSARAAWEAAARHLAGIVDAEPGEIEGEGGLEVLEARWKDWAAKRMENVTL